MGSKGDAAQGKKIESLSWQGSLYNLTLDEIQTHLGVMGKSLGSMNLDELLNQVAADMAIDNGCAASASSLHWQGSLTLARDLSKKSVDDLLKDIQQKKSDNTLGEMTLEDLLVKAGVVNVSQHALWMQPQSQSQSQHQQNPMAANYMLTANPVLDAQYTENQMTMSPSSLMDTVSDSPTPGRRKRVAPGDVAGKTVERRQKRMIKNRESAARSRARKQAYTQELENKISLLEEENGRLRRQRAMEILPCVPPTEPKYQLHRTGSAPF